MKRTVSTIRSGGQRGDDDGGHAGASGTPRVGRRDTQHDPLVTYSGDPGGEARQIAVTVWRRMV